MDPGGPGPGRGRGGAEEVSPGGWSGGSGGWGHFAFANHSATFAQFTTFHHAAT